MIRRAVLGFTLCCLAGATAAWGHPISVSATDLFVGRDRIHATIEVFFEDLVLYHGLQPDADNYFHPQQLAEAREAHRAFLLKYFTLLDVQGNPLPGKVTEVAAPELDPRGLAVVDLMAYSLVYQIEYAVSAPPEFLTVKVDFGGEDSVLPVMMELRVKQEGHPMLYPVELNRELPYTVRFDWDVAPLSPTASKEERERWQAEMRERTLGITNYSSVYSFLYITDQEIRHEILLPLLTLETWLPIARSDKNYLEVPEQEAARKTIAEFFSQGNPVEIDGVAVRPVVDRIDFYGLDLKDFAQRAEPRRVHVASARVGVILVYGTKGPPQHVKATWEKFNWQVWELRSTVLAYDQTRQHTFYPAKPTLEWTSPAPRAIPPVESLAADLPPPPTWRVPLATLTLAALAPLALVVGRRRGASWKKAASAGALVIAVAAAAWPWGQVEMRDPLAPEPALPQPEAQAVFATLHKNIYRAFDYHDESAVYDALARSVDGPLLTEIYLQVHRGLAMQEQGGAVAHVRSVEIVDGRSEPLPAAEAGGGAFAYRCTWNVEGTVEHWGHVHSRTNQYRARFVVRPHDGQWKIDAMEVLGQKRLRFVTRLRSS